MKRLDVINDAIATTGEAPLNEEDTRHPSVVSVLRILEQVNSSMQSNKDKGFWFNRETVTLLKDTSGKVPVPADILAAEPTDRNKDYIKRGGFLYSPSRATNVLNEDVELEVVRLIPFDDLPEVAQQAIAAQTIWRFHSDFEADELKLRTIKEQVGLTRRGLNAAEITNARANTKNNPQVAFFINGFRATRRGYR